MELFDLLGVALLIGALVLGVLASRGKANWGWVVGLVGAALAVLARRRSTPRPVVPPPVPEPVADAVRPVLEVADAQANERRETIRDANEDPDPTDRLDRLAELNDGGRE